MTVGDVVQVTCTGGHLTSGIVFNSIEPEEEGFILSQLMKVLQLEKGKQKKSSCNNTAVLNFLKKVTPWKNVLRRYRSHSGRTHWHHASMIAKQLVSPCPPQCGSSENFGALQPSEVILSGYFDKRCRNKWLKMILHLENPVQSYYIIWPRFRNLFDFTVQVRGILKYDPQMNVRAFIRWSKTDLLFTVLISPVHWFEYLWFIQRVQLNPKAIYTVCMMIVVAICVQMFFSLHNTYITCHCFPTAKTFWLI